MFTTGFGRFASGSGNAFITCDVEGFQVTARLYRDDYAESPDKRYDGYWPSLDPQSDGYIGPKSKSTLRRHMAKAQAHLDAWNNNEWFYCGVCLTVARNGIQLTDDYANALWGVECNHPEDLDNKYALDVANDELLADALDDARAKLAALCAPCPAL